MQGENEDEVSEFDMSMFHAGRRLLLRGQYREADRLDRSVTSCCTVQRARRKDHLVVVALRAAEQDASSLMPQQRACARFAA